jgi:hypothetical protein
MRRAAYKSRMNTPDTSRSRPTCQKRQKFLLDGKSPHMLRFRSSGLSRVNYPSLVISKRLFHKIVAILDYEQWQLSAFYILHPKPASPLPAPIAATHEQNRCPPFGLKISPKILNPFRHQWQTTQRDDCQPESQHPLTAIVFSCSQFRRIQRAIQF